MWVGSPVNAAVRPQGSGTLHILLSELSFIIIWAEVFTEQMMMDICVVKELPDRGRAEALIRQAKPDKALYYPPFRSFLRGWFKEKLTIMKNGLIGVMTVLMVVSLMYTQH